MKLAPLSRPSVILTLLALLGPTILVRSAEVYDIVIYGGTSGGVAAAVQSARMNKSVILIEPTRRLGGLTTGGLGQTDIGNKQAIGGISREFYTLIHSHYQKPDSWKWQKKTDYQSGGQSRTGAEEKTMWTFEPSAALQVFEDLIDVHGIKVAYGERLDLNGGVITTPSQPRRIISIKTESGRTFQGRMFIDATYEGDLLAKAGVSYTVGREANSQYNETLNGVQTAQARHHQLQPGIDPYIRRGDPTSGLLPGIDPTGPGAEGEADEGVQAFCFRMCLTDHPGNRLPFRKPAAYDEGDYELLFRNFEAGEKSIPWNNSSMPNRKTDVNNNKGFSTDFIGQNYDYPEADYPARREIARRHLNYQQGLMWTLSNHPRVPAHVRREISKWGPCRDEFMEGEGWQEQLYIREARRMVGAYVMTQHNCQARQTAPDSVGLAAYTMDSHNIQRYVDANGHVRNEGDVQVGGFPPYPISYRSLIPQTNECANLLVPVCLSASHIAFGSIRMEPVFMVLGQSAATAAAQAIEQQVSVQNIDYAKLRQRLLADKQVLAYSGPAPAAARGLDARNLPGQVIDDAHPSVTRTGFDTHSTSTPLFVGSGYSHDGNTDKGRQEIRYPLTVPADGPYEVRLAYSAFSNRATNVPVTIHHANGKKTVTINQRVPPPIDRTFISLGTYPFRKGGEGAVTVSNAHTDGYVVADAVQLLP